MTRWKLTVEYDGAGFHGWQRQEDVVSVQGVLEAAIVKFSGEAAALHVAGRTDTGVHARANIAHVDLARDTGADQVRDALNFHARPYPVVVTAVQAVAADFHARFSATERHYRYRILNRRAPSALQGGQSWHVPKPLDSDAMQAAADLLLGQHDFSTFRAQGCQANSPLRTLDRLRVEQAGEVITLDVRARSFLYRQMRNMAGTLTLVGSGRWSLAAFAEAFAAKDRRAGGPTAPAHGLTLWDVSHGTVE